LGAPHRTRKVKVEFITHLYERFNARDIEALLAAMSEDVMW